MRSPPAWPPKTATVAVPRISPSEWWVKIGGITIRRIANEKMAVERVVWELFSLPQGLGVLSVPTA